MLWFFFAYIPQYRSVLDVEYQILGIQKCINKWIWQSPYLSLYQQCNLFEALEILQYATHSHTLYPSQRNLLGSCMLTVIWKKIIQLILTISPYFLFALNLHRWHNEVVCIVNLQRTILYAPNDVSQYFSIQRERRVYVLVLWEKKQFDSSISFWFWASFVVIFIYFFLS